MKTKKKKYKNLKTLQKMLENIVKPFLERQGTMIIFDGITQKKRKRN